jgi:hypothetical protein
MLIADLFLINKQIYEDAVEVMVCGEFVLQFLERKTETCARTLIGSAGERKSLLENIGLWIG